MIGVTLASSRLGGRSTRLSPQVGARELDDFVAAAAQDRLQHIEAEALRPVKSHFATERSARDVSRHSASATFLLTKSETCANDIVIDEIDARGRRPGEERPRLFDIAGGITT